MNDNADAGRPAVDTGDGHEDEVQHDLNVLIGTALGLAGDQLTEHAGFLPMAVVVQTDGDIRLVAVSPVDAEGAELDADALIGDLYQALTQQRAANRAAAVVCDIHLPEDNTDAIHVVAEHSSGICVSAVRPYRLDNGDLALAEPFLEAAERTIWTERPAGT